MADYNQRKRTKVVKVGVPVNGTKEIKQPRITYEFYSKIPKWSFKRCDFAHDNWGFCKACKIHDVEQALMRLQAFEGQTWGEILTDKSGRDHRTKNHQIPIAEIDRAAQERLKQLGYKLIEELYSLTVTGEDRLWGEMDYESGTCNIIWLDNKHSIYKVSKS